MPDSAPTKAIKTSAVPCKEPAAPPYPPTGNYKKIFVFLDGTGNKFMDDVDDDGGNSNVVKLYTTLRVGLDPDTGMEQIAYYHPGVGTMGDPSIRHRIPRWWSMIKGLAFGYGFQANVLDAYRYLMHEYKDGDQIYIFGFSRGAYTARTLASLLHGFGLLCPGNEGHLLYAWNMFLDKLGAKRSVLKIKPGNRDPNRHTGPHGSDHSIQRDDAFIQSFSRIVTVRFMGVWDTVSSVGWIFDGIRLLDMAQNPIIQVGRHAISIDERRAFYRDNLWGKPVDIDHPEWPDTLRKQGIHQDLAQVWFPGAHSDVGGSYAQAEAAPANASLEWMIGELKNHGAELCDRRLRTVLGKPGPDPILDPIYIPPSSADNKLHNSLEKIWKLLEPIPQQYYDKDDQVIQWRVPCGRPRAIPNKAIIHGSFVSRIDAPAPDQEPYSPPNLNRKQVHTFTPGPETTANLDGCYQYINPTGNSSMLADPRPIRYLKLGFGWVYFGLFWIVLAALLCLALLVLVILAALIYGALRIVCQWFGDAISHIYLYLDHFSILHTLFQFVSSAACSVAPHISCGVDRLYKFLHRWCLGKP